MTPQILYHAYAKSANFQNFRGEPMPTWEDLPDHIKSNWQAVAVAARVDLFQTPDAFTLRFAPDQAVEAINRAIKTLPGKEIDFRPGEISDGYHSFDELYAHRIELYIALCWQVDGEAIRTSNKPIVWRSKKHSDGTEWEGWFLLGIGQASGHQITYHLPMSKWEKCSGFVQLERAPDWDGHTSADVLDRLTVFQ